MADNSQTNTMQNWHGDNTPMQPGPDILSMLSGLIQKGLQASGGTDAQASQPQDNQPQLHPIAQAAQDGAVKATKEQAYQAVLQGGPIVAKHISDMYGSGNDSNFLPTQPTPAQAVNTLKGILPAQTSSTPTADPIQQQASNIVSPQSGFHPIGDVLNLLGTITGVSALNQGIKGIQLDNLEKAQKLTGKVPLQQSDIDKATLETNQKINQALTVPPTQAEKLQNAAAYAGYKTTALKDMLDNNNTAQTQQSEILKNMQGYSSWFNKPFGAMPKEAQQAVTKLKQLQLERLAVASELNKHQNLLASGGVSTSPFKEGQVYTDANGNTATFKNGKFQ